MASCTSTSTSPTITASGTSVLRSILPQELAVNAEEIRAGFPIPWDIPCDMTRKINGLTLDEMWRMPPKTPSEDRPVTSAELAQHFNAQQKFFADCREKQLQEHVKQVSPLEERAKSAYKALANPQGALCWDFELPFQTYSRPKYSRKNTGYLYVIFEEPFAVETLINHCTSEAGGLRNLYFELRIPRRYAKQSSRVQIIPWIVSDATYVHTPASPLDPKLTVFVGGLHGMVTAKALHSIMSHFFGEVVFVGIDTDRHKYPIGSGRVTFLSQTSFFMAVKAGHVDIRTKKFSKRVQIDPFLEDAPCMTCKIEDGTYFCRDRSCFRYLCGRCWEERHDKDGPWRNHRHMEKSSSREPRIRRDSINNNYSAGASPHYSAMSAWSLNPHLHIYAPLLSPQLSPPNGRPNSPYIPSHFDQRPQNKNAPSQFFTYPSLHGNPFAVI
ncbi:unnamed protein product, partial [Mesorhabditis spiculigera]